MKTLSIIIFLILISCKQNDNFDNIIVEQNFPQIKLSLIVNIKNRLNDIELSEISKKIYNKYDGENYESVFIKYMLPNIIEGTGSYATTHYRPNLEINRYELSNEEIEKIKLKFKIKGDYWVDRKLLIQFKKVNDSMYLKQYGDDYSHGKIGVIKEVKDLDTIYHIIDNDYGEYYVHFNSGDLAIFDTKGMIFQFAN